MPVAPTYPGVYIEEIPSGVHTITGVATSITAFIGRTHRGPTNEPVTINSFGDFERTFGGLWADSKLGYAVRDFFLNGGGQAIVVRVQQNAAARTFSLTMGGHQLSLRAENPGAWGNRLKASAQPVTGSASLLHGLKQSLGLEDADELFNVTLSLTDPNNPQRVIARETLRNVIAVKPEHPRYLGNVLKKESELARVADAPGAVGADLGVNTSNVKTKTDELAAALAAGDLKLPDAGPIDWNTVSTALGAVEAKLNELKTAVDGAATAFGQVVNDQLTGLESDDSLKTLIGSVKAPPITADELNQVAEQIDQENAAQQAALAKAELALPAQAAAQAASVQAQGAAQKAGDAKTKTADAGQSDASKKNARLQALDVAQQALAAALQLVPGANMAGTDGDPLTQASFLGDAGADFQSEKLGLYALEKADIFNLLCIPPYTGTDDIESGLITAAIQLCQEQRAMLILDPPSTWTSVKNAKQGVEQEIGEPSEYAAVFFPRLRQPDPLRDNQMADFAPCGAVAGVMARTDTQRGVWKAPAGLEATLAGVPQLSLTLTDDQNGELNPLGINCLRSLPTAGRVVWGARTRRGDDRLASEWKYIPVRRLANYIEESLYRGTQWVVFEPNDEPLWAQIRLNVGAFMHNLFRQGAFQGQTPRKAYFVKCDKETTTQNDINLGIVNIVVGFAPLKPAEFVIIQIQQIAGQVEA